MHLIDEVSSNRTDESTNLLKTQRKGQTQERKGKKSIPEPTVHGVVGVHKEIAEMRVYMWTPVVVYCQESWGLAKTPIGDLSFHGR